MVPAGRALSFRVSFRVPLRVPLRASFGFWPLIIVP
jgi:hypothetical protein